MAEKIATNSTNNEPELAKTKNLYDLNTEIISNILKEYREKLDRPSLTKVDINVCLLLYDLPLS
jgi:hypothetical protein